MTFALVQTIDVCMHPDGTYRLQAWRDSSRDQATPSVTVAGQESIPDGLRALADAIELQARVEFWRR